MADRISIAGLGEAMASVFDLHHRLHDVAGGPGGLGLPIAAMLISPALLLRGKRSSAETAGIRQCRHNFRRATTSKLLPRRRHQDVFRRASSRRRAIPYPAAHPGNRPARGDEPKS